MTTDRNPDRIVRAWLDQMPDETPDRVIDSVLLAVDATPQVRRPLLTLPTPGRSTPMTRLALIAAAAALGAALLGGALLLGGGRNNSPAITPAPASSPAPTEAPTAAPATPATSSANATPLATALRAKWLAAVPTIPAIGNGGGPVSLTIETAGTSAFVGNLTPGAAFGGTATAVGADQVRLVLERDSGGCAAGDEGTYRWTLSTDGSQLALVKLADACANRGNVFARTWVRSLTTATTNGAGVVDAFDPWFSIALPEKSYEPRQLDDFVEIGNPDGTDLLAWKNPQGFTDPCSQAERYPYTAGADALVGYFRQNPAFNIIENTPMTIDGRPAIHLVVEGKAGYTKCPGNELLTFTPKACDCHWVSTPGFRDSFYLVDVGSDTIVIEISVGATKNEKPIVDSIRIPATLPSQ
jgi:hypothetical protein